MTAHGICGLCRCEADLKDSHLLPASVYKLSRTAGDANPNPIVVTGRGAVSSSRQITADFLCARCEERFSKGGEAYVLAQCARPDGSFAVRQLLRSSTPLVGDAKWSVYGVRDTIGPQVEQYIYFAASVFWRASAKAWTFGTGAPRPCINLGDAYEEEFRRYLLSEAAFPQRARLFVHVWNDEQIHFTSVVPASYRIKGTHRHKFCIPGILFILFVGGFATERHNAGALNSSDGPFMWLCPWENDSLFDSFGQMVSRAIRSKRASV